MSTRNQDLAPFSSLFIANQNETDALEQLAILKSQKASLQKRFAKMLKEPAPGPIALYSRYTATIETAPGFPLNEGDKIPGGALWYNFSDAYVEITNDDDNLTSVIPPYALVTIKAGRGSDGTVTYINAKPIV